MTVPIWTLVLAGGMGRRLAGVTGGVPKQFWRIDGRRTLLEHTLDRLSPLGPPSRTVVVLNRVHEGYVGEVGRRGGRLLYQPDDRGTGAGVLLGLLAALDQDPHAILVVSPADHGVRAVSRFQAGLLTAAGRVRSRPPGVVLFGVEPDGPGTDYGWIRAGRPSHDGFVRRVEAFVEKPASSEHAKLRAAGAVWNTMVLAARGQSLLRLFARRQPALTRRLRSAWDVRDERRDEVLADAYERMSSCDFSRDVLAGATGLAVRVWPASIGWSDLGTPERLQAWRSGAAGSATSAA